MTNYTIGLREYAKLCIVPFAGKMLMKQHGSHYVSGLDRKLTHGWNLNFISFVLDISLLEQVASEIITAREYVCGDSGWNIFKLTGTNRQELQVLGHIICMYIQHFTKFYCCKTKRPFRNSVHEQNIILCCVSTFYFPYGFDFSILKSYNLTHFTAATFLFIYMSIIYKHKEF